MNGWVIIRTVAAGLGLLLAAAIGPPPTDPTLAYQAPSGRLTVVISDLHFGSGRDPATGQWRTTEDFRWPSALSSFLRAVNQAGIGATDLVLNGDTFELAASLPGDCRYANARLGCSEPDALRHLETTLSAHAAEIAGLRAFARSGGNRLVLVPGDHDAALLFPSVASRVVAALDAPGRVEVAVRGYWASQDGAVQVEHGHQLAGDPFRFASWPEPFIREGGRSHLERTWGEQLTASVYQQYESEFPIVDNIAEKGAGMKVLWSADPAALRSAEPNQLLKFFLSQLTWQQFRLDLDGGDVQPPEWDLPATRRSGTAFFVESLLPDDPFREAAGRVLKEGRLNLDPSDLSDSEVAALCDYRAALRRARRRLERTLSQVPHVGAAATECPRVAATRGAPFDYFWQSRDAYFSEALRHARERVATSAASLRVLVLGHRHLPDRGFVPARDQASPIVLNSGAWHRTVTPFQLEQVMKARGWSSMELLRTLQPEDLAACYGVVWIDSDARRSMPQFRFWREDGRWGGLARDASDIAGACSPVGVAGAP